VGVYFVFVDFLSHVAYRSCFRDGDVVVVRVSADETSLDIRDNHLPDPNVVVPDPEVNVQTQNPQ
jgi:hypothetical protein